MKSKRKRRRNKAQERMDINNIHSFLMFVTI
nr:MAG TPA: hypothetical protein [Caudoviricetes sp.]